MTRHVLVPSASSVSLLAAVACNVFSSSSSSSSEASRSITRRGATGADADVDAGADADANTDADADAEAEADVEVDAGMSGCCCALSETSACCPIAADALMMAERGMRATAQHVVSS